MRDFLVHKVMEGGIPADRSLKQYLGATEAPPAATRGWVNDEEEYPELYELKWYNRFFPETLKVAHCLAYLRFLESGGDGVVVVDDNEDGASSKEGSG